MSTRRLIIGGAIIICLALGAGGVFVKVTEGPAQESPKEIPVHSARIIFGGDMMFDRYIRKISEIKGSEYVFSCVAPLLSRADLVVANLEGPITGNASVSMNTASGGPDNMTFTFSTSTPALLSKENIRLVNIGNNHIMNFSRAGLEETKQHLSAAGVAYFGDPDALEADRVARMNIQGIPVSFVNWSDWTSDNTDHTVAQVRIEKEAGRVVFVYTHWGVEYATTSPARVHELAHEFVDAGADIVIGSHPHVVEEHELYKGKNIYYSLGNFIFDQYWDASVRNGLLLDVSFTRSGISSIAEIPITLETDGRTCLTK